MSMLKRQQNGLSVKAFSARLPEEKYNTLVEFALSKRFTLSAAVTHLLDKALNAENGEPYTIYEQKANSGN